MTLVNEHPRLVDLASHYLSITHAEAEQHHREVPEVHAVYFWEAKRGGGSLIIGVDESMLFAGSSVSFDAHLAAFRDGKRTDLADLESVRE